MTKLSYRGLVLVSLLALSFAANADNRDRRGGWQSDASGAWRLGHYRGGSRGSEILFWDGNRWRVMPGSAHDVSDGWVIGTDRRRGGFGIYRWNGRSWDRVPGGAVSIGGTYRRPWVINNRNERYVWNGYDWDRVRNSGQRARKNRYDREYQQNRFTRSLLGPEIRREIREDRRRERRRERRRH